MKTIDVIANPFTSLDTEGAPNGFTFSDPLAVGTRPFSVVGGTLRTRIERPRGDEHDGLEAKVKVGSHLSLKPHPVILSNYHLERIVSGEMFCADEVSAKAANVKFESPALLMERARDARVAEWKAEHGGELPICARLKFEWDEKTGVRLIDPETNVTPAPPAPKPSVAPAPAAGTSEVTSGAPRAPKALPMPAIKPSEG